MHILLRWLSLNVPSFITRLNLGRQLTTYGLLVLQFTKIYSMPGIFHACNYCSSIFWKEVNNVIASSTKVSDDPVVGGGRYFSILLVERHLTEPISCFSSSKGEMFDDNLPWNVEVADDIGQGRLCKKKIWNKTKFQIVFITMLIILIIDNSKNIYANYFNNKLLGGGFLLWMIFFWIRSLLVQESSCKCMTFFFVFFFSWIFSRSFPGMKLFLVSVNSLF